MRKHKTTWHEGQPVDTLIGAQVVLQGDVHFSGGLYVEGRIHGKVVALPGEAATLTLAENGRIDGEVEVPVVVIHGQLDGNIHAGERVELASKARVNGNVYYRVAEMRPGAVLNGRLVHADSAEAQAAVENVVPMTHHG